MVYLSYVLMTLLGFFGIFLIGLILLQRGRGGGLAGAFGGMGGQSAFGTKAGDVFTRITIGVAAAWILLCAGSVLALHYSTGIRTDTSIFKQQDAADAPKKAEPKTSPAGDAVEFPPKGSETAPNTPSPKTGTLEKDGNLEDKAGGETKSAPENKPEQPATDGEDSKNTKSGENNSDAKDETKSKDNADGDGKTGDSKPDPKTDSKPQ